LPNKNSLGLTKHCSALFSNKTDTAVLMMTSIGVFLKTYFNVFDGSIFEHCDQKVLYLDDSILKQNNVFFFYLLTIIIIMFVQNRYHFS
jgi:hypothetical protein